MAQFKAENLCVQESWIDGADDESFGEEWFSVNQQAEDRVVMQDKQDEHDEQDEQDEQDEEQEEQDEEHDKDEDKRRKRIETLRE